MYIAVAGNIGSGKTTLTGMLSRHYGWEARYEAITENPYIEDYYKDIKRWAFNLETYFLKERFRDLLIIRQADNDIVQDRSIYEGVYVFARNNKDMGQLSERDFETFMELFEQMTDVVREPELMIYLRSSLPHLVNNIQKRGRDYESSLSLEYLGNLNNLYEDFIYKHYKGRVLTIEVDGMDFQHNPKDFAVITDKIDRVLYGLFPENNSNQ